MPIFWPLLCQMWIFLNETNTIRLVPLNYMFSAIFNSIYSIYMLKCLIYLEKTSKNGQTWPYISDLESRFYSVVKCARPKRWGFLHFSVFFHENFRINVELNFALDLLLGFLHKISKKNWPPNSEIPPGNFRFWPSKSQ